MGLKAWVNSVLDEVGNADSRVRRLRTAARCGTHMEYVAEYHESLQDDDVTEGEDYGELDERFDDEELAEDDGERRSGSESRSQGGDDRGRERGSGRKPQT